MVRARGRGATLLVALLLAGACSDDAAAPPATSTSAPPTEATTTTAVASSDLDHLLERIVALHPDPFHHVEEAELRGLAGADPGDPDQLLVAAMRLANLGAGEGHGGVYPWAQPDLEAWPLHLYDFPDGLRVVAGEGVPIGARLTAVGGTPVAEVVEALRPLVPHDTAATVQSRLPAFAVHPAVLRGLGFDPSTLTWELADGTTATMAPPATVPSDELAELLGLFQDQVPPTLPHDRNEAFATEPLGSTLVVAWNQVQRSSGDVSMTELAESLVAQVASGAVDRIVLDVRHNPGGDIGLAAPLEEAVGRIEADRPGTVRVLIGRGTFSAASYVIARLAAEHDLLLIGEPTGGSSRSYADPEAVDLPRSGIRAYVDTRLYESGEARWEPLVPDVEAVPTFEDWQAGRDPALEAALR
jgi:hypothetical protein